MSLEENINKEHLPKHLAIIMDGNGRWAKQQGFLRSFGHENGTKSVRIVVETCARLGIPHLTLYAFLNSRQFFFNFESVVWVLIHKSVLLLSSVFRVSKKICSRC